MNIDFFQPYVIIPYVIKTILFFCREKTPLSENTLVDLF